MSRIDEALRRARGEAAHGGTSTPPAYENPVEDVDLWDLPAETPQLWSSLVESQAQAEPSVDAAPVAPVPHVDVPSTMVAASPKPIVPAPTALPTPQEIAEEISVIEITPPQPDPQPVAALPVQPAPPVSLPARVVPAAPRSPEPNGSTLVSGACRRDAVEQYRKLAATLHHVQANRGVRILLCTSAVMSEGKTVTAANLALTLSTAFQRRVLLIDADLRRPRLHSLFDVANREGLYEALGADADRKVNVVQVSPLLSLVTAGRPGKDPVHVLTSERLARVFEDAGTNFDWVIIDTPPVLVLPDAGLLMNLVDGAVFVVGAGMTTHKMAKRATDALGRDRIVGVVMNRASDRTIQENYGGRYYGYDESASQAE